MEVIKWSDFLHNGIHDIGEAAVTVGVFDGVHIGHQELVRKIQNYRGETGAASPLVFTFENNPSAFFHPYKFLGTITTVEQKMRLFEGMGIGNIVLIDFSADFSKLTGSEFFSIIRKHTDVRYVCLGKNFHCGRDNDTNSQRVRKMFDPEGITVEILDQITFKGEPVSSTRIRKNILAGNIADVNAMLGKPYELDCSSGCNEIAQILPADGRYAVRVICNSEELLELEIKNKSLILPLGGRDLKNMQTIQFIDRVIA